MNWIHNFQLFLFDFDGLLVNTEHLHYQAYIEMMEAQGFKLTWDFPRYASVAHLSAIALKEALYAEFPGLDPNWAPLYEAKKRAYYNLIVSGKVSLLPGVEKLLYGLEKEGIRRAVATNSFLEQIELIRAQIPALQTIPHWITRENYEKQKPDPQAYLKAIEQVGKPGDKIIGFEDTIRGIQSLSGTPALPVLVCPSDHPLKGLAPEGTIHFESFDEVSF